MIELDAQHMQDDYGVVELSTILFVMRSQFDDVLATELKGNRVIGICAKTSIVAVRATVILTSLVHVL